MRTIILSFLLLSVMVSTAQRSTILFNDGWLFHRGAALGADEAFVSDSSWRPVQLPHDWSIEDMPGTRSPFNRGAVSQVSGGFTTGGTGWYRKWFRIPSSEKGKRFYLYFEGVYMNTHVYVNGKSMGGHPYGYTSFYYDITDQLKFDTSNMIAVRVRNEGENSRWYSGSGIYRNVWLISVNPLHVAHWGTFITTQLLSESSAIVQIKTTIRNSDIRLAPTTARYRLVDETGMEVAKSESSASINDSTFLDFQQTIGLQKPALWSVETPHLYTAIIEVYNGQQLVDTYETKFGVRSISFDARNGFRLNGKSMKLKGGCVHHDNGPLGASAYNRAEERKVELLKASGYNAVRAAHNPPSPAFLEACDRLGMLVIDEAFDTWRNAKNQFDYNLYFDSWWRRDLESIILRDRNHPSVIMWSTGNEIPNRDKPEVVAVSKMLSEYVHQLDSTRPVTCGVNGVEENKDPFFATLDVAGYNYAPQKYREDHKRLPQRIMYGSESFAIDAFDYWMEVEDNPSVIGDFVWTSFDYIGEASIGWLGFPQTQNFYPWTLAHCGDIDICGWKRPQSYYRDVLWTKNALSVFVTSPKPTFDTNQNKASWSRWHWKDELADWNWKGYENKLVAVSVYSSCDEVELFLNGKSLGRKQTSRSNKFTAEYSVAYQPGSLKAMGYNGGKKVSETELKSAAEPSQVSLCADRSKMNADGQDLAYVTVELTDANNIRNPKAENLVSFEVEGPATIVGVGNANPRSIESYQQPYRKAWQGRCLVIVKADKKGGEIIVTAKSEGLKPGQVRIASVGN